MYYDGVFIHQDNGDVAVWDFYMVDQSFFNIFTIPLIRGNVDLLYSHLNSIMISKSIALKFFGHTDIVGKTVEITYNKGNKLFSIVGVYEDQNHSSSVHPNIIGNIEYVDNTFKDQDKYPWAETYLMTNKNIDVSSLNTKINEYVLEKNYKNEITYDLQALNDIYFHSQHIESYFSVQEGNLKK